MRTSSADGAECGTANCGYALAEGGAGEAEQDAREGSAFGAAMLGMEALGMIDSIERAAELVQIEQTAEPDAQAAALYAEARILFAQLYDNLTPAFHALARAERRNGQPRTN